RADAQAIGFRPVNQRLSIGEIQYLETTFQIFPGLKPLFQGRAFGLGLVGAKKDVPLVSLQAQGVGYCAQFTGHNHLHGWHTTGMRSRILILSPWSARIGALLSRDKL